VPEASGRARDALDKAFRSVLHVPRCARPILKSASAQVSGLGGGRAGL